MSFLCNYWKKLLYHAGCQKTIIFVRIGPLCISLSMGVSKLGLSTFPQSISNKRSCNYLRCFLTSMFVIYCLEKASCRVPMSVDCYRKVLLIFICWCSIPQLQHGFEPLSFLEKWLQIYQKPNIKIPSDPFLHACWNMIYS